MRWISSSFVALAMLLWMAAPLCARPFEAKQVPADAKWILHVDVDALQASKTWEMFRGEIEQNLEIREKLQGVEMISGMKLPQDLHSITLFGSAFNEGVTVVIIEANADRERLIGLLSQNPSYASSKHGQHDVHAWEDNSKQMYGGFQGTDRVVMGQSRESIVAALDVLDGKAQALQPGAALAGGSGAGVLLYVAGDQLSQLGEAQKARSPLINQVELAWLALSEQNEEIVLKAAIHSKTAEAAEQMRVSLEGIKAIIALAGAAQDADPPARTLTSALQSITARTTEKILNIEGRWRLGALRDFISAMKARTGEAEQPAKQ